MTCMIVSKPIQHIFFLGGNNMILGIESFTVGKLFRADFPGTLKKVSELGLPYIEWIAHVTKEDHGMGLGFTPQQAVQVFGDYGMKLTGGIFYAGKDGLFDLDEMQKVIDWYGEAGCSAIGLSDDWFGDEEFFKRRMDTYNELGRRCAQYGMYWIYHNHFHEQQKIGDKTVLDVMLDMTDPSSVALDWDIYWGLRGGCDPAEHIRKYGNRIQRFHCKDFPASRMEHVNMVKDLPDEILSWETSQTFNAYRLLKPEDFTECGSGIIQWQDVVDAANEAGIPYMFLEQDHTTYPDKFQSLAVSRDYLLSLNGLTAK